MRKKVDLFPIYIIIGVITGTIIYSKIFAVDVNDFLEVYILMGIGYVIGKYFD